MDGTSFNLEALNFQRTVVVPIRLYELSRKAVLQNDK